MKPVHRAIWAGLAVVSCALGASIFTTAAMAVPYGKRAQTPGGDIHSSPEDWPDATKGAYPQANTDKTIDGRVMVICRLLSPDKLSGCRAEHEAPVGMGFGDFAVKRVMRGWSASPRTVTGVVSGDEIRFDYLVPAALHGKRRSTTQAVWLQTPSAADFDAVRPPIRRGRKGGDVAMRCRVDSGGLLRDCAVVGESPAKVGFGDAALALAPRFRVAPAADGPDFTATDLVISVRFPDLDGATEEDLQGRQR